jgi:hypothetical protein
LGQIRGSENRADVKLPLCPLVRKALNNVVGAIEPVLDGFIRRGRDENDRGGAATSKGRCSSQTKADGSGVGTVTLVELSSLHSLPGSKAQLMHKDTNGTQACILTAFCALQDVELAMGPTILWPGTHTNRMDGPIASSGPPFPALLRKGSVLLMDSRLAHCGGANRADVDRCLFYHSWQLPHTDAAGSTASLLEDYRGKLRYAHWRLWTSPAPTLASLPASRMGDLLLRAMEAELTGGGVGGGSDGGGSGDDSREEDWNAINSNTFVREVVLADDGSNDDGGALHKAMTDARASRHPTILRRAARDLPCVAKWPMAASKDGKVPSSSSLAASLYAKGREFPVRAFVSKRPTFWLDGTNHPQAVLTTTCSFDTTLGLFLDQGCEGLGNHWAHRYLVEDLSVPAALPFRLDVQGPPVDRLLSAFPWKPQMCQLFVSAGDTITQCHRDRFDNVYTCVSGSRTFLLAHPSQRLEAEADGVSAKEHWSSALRKSRDVRVDVEAARNEGRPLPHKTWKHADFPAPAAGPESVSPTLLETVRFAEASLGPADVLFLPTGWWHMVMATGASAEEGAPAYSCSVNWYYNAPAGCEE